MTSVITPNKIKQNNKKVIYQYIYHKRKVSLQEICIDLHLSRPTVTTNLNSLEEDGYIEKSGQINSDAVGRKASAYGINTRFKVAVGVEITRKEIKMMALDLYGERIDRSVTSLPFRNEESCYQQMSEEILEFIHRLKLQDSQILGIGFAIQGLVSPDGRFVLYGKILNCSGLSADVFEKYLPYRCRFIHDSDSAAIAELWSNPDLNEAFFLSISKHLGGSIIRDRQIIVGKHGHSATYEHIVFHPQRRKIAGEPKLCYCGSRGCIDTLCSLHDLLLEDEDLDSFFAKKADGDEEVLRRWSDYLSDLGEVLNMLHLVYDSEFILGGYLAPYLTEEDLKKLYYIISELTAFPEQNDFLTISKMPKHSITIGGALIFLQDFLKLDTFS